MAAARRAASNRKNTRRAAASRTQTRRPASKRARRKTARSARPRRWVQGVKTVSTHPPAGTFQKDAASIARIMASKRVSPGGLGLGIRMIQYYLNRGGRGLSATRRAELERAKRLLQRRMKARETKSRAR